MVFVLREPTIGIAHRLAILTILDYGEVIGNTIELPSPLVISVERPEREPRVYPTVGLSRQALDVYAVQLMSKDIKGFSYTYGNRFRDYDGIDQMQKVIWTLTNDRNSRRAIMHTWKVSIDLGGEEIPCVQTLQFLIRNNRLNCIATIRSNDILLAWGANAYGIENMMEYVCCALKNVSMGTLTTMSASAHIYHIRDANIITAVQNDMDTSRVRH